MLGTIGCILAIALLIITVFKGLHPLIAGLLATAVVIVCCQVPVWDTFLNGYSAGICEIMSQLFVPVALFSA